MSTNTAVETPEVLGADVFDKHNIRVYMEYRQGRPRVALEVGGEATWLTSEQADHLALHLPEKLQAVAVQVERLNDEAAA